MVATMQKSQWDTLQGPETESDIREWGRYTQDQERLQYDDEDGFIGTLLVPLGICLRIMLRYVDTLSLSSFLRLLYRLRR